MRTTRNLMLGALACAAMFGTMSAATAQTHLKVMVFPGLSNFSIFAAQHKNLFAKHGLAVEFLNTPNSDVLRNGLAKGDHQIAHAAVDNAVAMVELAKADVAIRRQRLQPHLRPAGDQRVPPSARQNGRGGCA
jgi:ABC-type nitrate/sulfonate/bicarbonate transport system substrate-binding protein